MTTSERFSALFADGGTFETSYGRCSTFLHDAGDVNLNESGWLVAFDPYMNSAKAFDRRFEPSDYREVKTLVARLGAPWGNRVAAAVVMNSYRAIDAIRRGTLRWQPASFKGEAAQSTTGACFPIDYGLAAYIDERAAHALAAMDPKRARLRSSLEIAGYGQRIDFDFMKNLVAFRSGLGDVANASWWGLGDNDAIVCLVTDFFIVGDPVTMAR